MFSIIRDVFKSEREREADKMVKNYIIYIYKFESVRIYHFGKATRYSHMSDKNVLTINLQCQLGNYNAH